MFRHLSFRTVLAACCVSALALLSGADEALAQRRGNGPGKKIHVHEGGFRVRNFDQCKWNGGERRVLPQKYHIRIPPPLLTDIECGQGSWGEGLYLSYVDGLFAGEPYVLLSRMDELGDVASFTWIAVYDLRGFDMSFSPPSWRDGEEIFLTVWPTSPYNPSSWIQTFSPDGSQSTQATSFPNIRIGSSAADPTGAFGGDFFYGRGSELMRQEAGGAVSVFAPVSTLGDMRFGPGGAWGDDLYLEGSVVSPDGTVTPFPVGFSEFDWAFGNRFDGDMFAVDYANEQILRITPAGSSSVFASGVVGPIAFCGGSLWIGGPDGCSRITPRN